MKASFLLLITFFTLLINGCSTRGYKVYNDIVDKNVTTNPQSDLSSENKNSEYKTKVIFNEYEKWRGSPYKLGGVSLNGVDCSSFIQQVYYNGFGLNVPRTTIKQLQIGYKIKKEELRVGDMIFFKTGWDVRHVGIIIEDGAFVHASTSQGVTISSIHNPYWKNNYYQSRRVLP